MNDAPYQPPKAELIDEQSPNTNPFYVVSIGKFAILFFATMGLYSLYWFYANWNSLRQSDQLKIWPVPRAIFSIFFTHSLFRKIQEKITLQQNTFSWQPDLMATIFVLLAIGSHILDRLSMRGIGSPATDVLGLLILPLMYLPLAKAQHAINFCSGDPEGQTNSTITGANIGWIAVGLLFWGVVILGLIIMVGEIAL